VVQTDRFEKFLETIFGWPSLALKVTFSSRDSLLTRVTGFLIAGAIAGYYGDMGLVLLSYLKMLPGARKCLPNAFGPSPSGLRLHPS
jgi:hypothetical protein